MGNMHGPTVPGQTSYVGLHWDGQKWGDPISFIAVPVMANDVFGDDHVLAAVGYRMLPEGTFAAIAEYDNTSEQWSVNQLQERGELKSVWSDGKGYFVAVGDSGMVYTKDGYAASWEYFQAPTAFSFTTVAGISKKEIYASAQLNLVTGQSYEQVWKYLDDRWIKLMDNQDSTGMAIQIPEAADEVYGVAAIRCSVTDSLYLYVVGFASFEFTSQGQSLLFTKRNLATEGLPSSQQASGFITLFSPNDYWVSGLEYQIYHWNGSDFKKIEPIPALPYGQLWGVVSRVQRSHSGKMWMLLEMSSQVFAVLQGTS